MTDKSEGEARDINDIEDDQERQRARNVDAYINVYLWNLDEFWQKKYPTGDLEQNKLKPSQEIKLDELGKLRAVYDAFFSQGYGDVISPEINACVDEAKQEKKLTTLMKEALAVVVNGRTIEQHINAFVDEIKKISDEQAQRAKEKKKFASYVISDADTSNELGEAFGLLIADLLRVHPSECSYELHVTTKTENGQYQVWNCDLKVTPKNGEPWTMLPLLQQGELANLEVFSSMGLRLNDDVKSGLEMAVRQLLPHLKFYDKRVDYLN